MNRHLELHSFVSICAVLPQQEVHFGTNLVFFFLLNLLHLCQMSLVCGVRPAMCRRCAAC